MPVFETPEPPEAFPVVCVFVFCCVVLCTPVLECFLVSSSPPQETTATNGAVALANITSDNILFFIYKFYYIKQKIGHALF